MKLETILRKYKIQMKEINYNNVFKKLPNSKAVNFLNNKYFLDETKIMDSFDIQLFDYIDDNDLYENMSSLEIEGIVTSKAISSKAQKASEEIVEDGLINYSTFNNNDFNMQIIKLINNRYDLMDKKNKPPKIIFYRNTGINLALNFINSIGSNFNLSDELMLNYTYQLLIVFGNALEEKEQLEKRSLYRKGEVSITNGLMKIDEGIPGKDVKKQMDKLLNLFKDEKIRKYSNWTFASIIHFLFIEIHPYYDGNGRMARLLIKAIANKEDSGGHWAKHINKIILWLQPAYNKSIQLSRKTNDLTFFLVFMDYVYKSSFLTEQIISEENERLLEKKRSINGLQPTILCFFLIQQMPLSWKHIKKHIVGAKELTEQRIKQILNKMVENDLLAKDKMDNTNIYVLSERIKKTLASKGGE
ncbi:MAG: hypothetical protein TYPL_1810 [Candidatus Tyloplasma litorale]|nr:MAG: hypothetical protein TYPL_1810 [Mycoplasmatales bacterium]